MGRGQSIEIAGHIFSKKSDALAYLKDMLNRYHPEEAVSDVDANFLRHALAKHPSADEKIGSGISSFFVRRADYGTKCFWIKRVDGTEEKFSYISCISS